MSNIHSLLFVTLTILLFSCSNGVDTHNKPTDKSDSITTIPTTTLPDAHTYLWGPAVSTITGTICEKYVWGVQHENETEAKDTIIVIALKEKIAVVEPAGVDTTNFEENYPNERNVDTIQLVLPSHSNCQQLIGKTVRLKGVFFHADNGHHFTDVLLDVSEIKEEAK